jgi:hypothetical protein
MLMTGGATYAILGDTSNQKFHIEVMDADYERSDPPAKRDALVRSNKDISQLHTKHIVVPRAAIPEEARCTHLQARGECLHGSCYLLEHSLELYEPLKKHPRAWMGNFNAKVRWTVDCDYQWLVNVQYMDNNDGRLIVLRSDKWEKAVHPDPQYYRG